MIATSSSLDLSHTGAARASTPPAMAADDHLWHALQRAGVSSHEVTLSTARWGAGDGPAVPVVVAQDASGRWAGSPEVAIALAAALDGIAGEPLDDLAHAWREGRLVETPFVEAMIPGDTARVGSFTDWTIVRATPESWGIARIGPDGDAWGASWRALGDGGETRGSDTLIGDTGTPPRALAEALAPRLPGGVGWRVEVADERRRLIGVGTALDGAVTSWTAVLWTALVLAIALVGACGDNVDPAGPDGGMDVADSADRPRPDAEPAPDAGPPPDAEILGDCAVTCAGEELSPCGDWTVCRPSYRRCLPTPNCDDACDAGGEAVLACSSSSNCTCESPTGTTVSCIHGYNP